MTGGDPTRAPGIMRHYGCGGCHTIPGIPGADGQVGPQLSGLLHRVYIGDGIPNSADHLVQWIRAPHQFSSHSAMPATGIIALGVYSELKHVVLVDHDVDPFDSDDVLWAMTTRFQGDVSTMFLPKVNGHVLDPSQTPEFNPALPAKGVTCKAIFDCTAPFHLRGEFERAKFMEVDPRPFAPELFDDHE